MLTIYTILYYLTILCPRTYLQNLGMSFLSSNLQVTHSLKVKRATISQNGKKHKDTLACRWVAIGPSCTRSSLLHRNSLRALDAMRSHRLILLHAQY